MIFLSFLIFTLLSISMTWYSSAESSSCSNGPSKRLSLSLTKQKKPQFIKEEIVDYKGKGKEKAVVSTESTEHNSWDEDSFWNDVSKAVDKMEMDIVDLETPRLELLSVKDSIDVTAHKTEDRVDKTEDEMDKTEVKREFSLKRKRVGESVFTRDAVKGWQSSRIKAWENRYVNPEGYYFRFVVPGEGQQNGSWCKEEVELFMARYKEWVANGWKVGASWGLFSKGIPHRVGYQCMNHYRKLVNDGILKDASYGIVDGKLKQLYKDRAPAGDIPNTELGSIWDSAEVKEEEENVNRWLKEFHSRSGASTTSRPISTPKPKMTRVVKKTNEKLNILSLVKRMPKKKMISEDDDFMSESEPELIHLPQHNWDDEWNKRLDKYKEFLMPYLDHNTRNDYRRAKRHWRRGLITTEILMKKNMVLRTPLVNSDSIEKNKPKTQLSLSRFFTGVKQLKTDTPDELVSFVRIPNELYSGVKQIKRVSKAVPVDGKMKYVEIDHMINCGPILHQLLTMNTPSNISEVPISPVEGILMDPPWDYYLNDGRNDGHCYLNISGFQSIMAEVSQYMTAGLIFIWVHKLIQADIVRFMSTIDCKYVENLVWFKKSINNMHLDEPSPYISSTKEILLMFKKGEGFELRHQRSADVIIDFQVPRDEWIADDYTEPKPVGVYDMIETLLPKALYNDTLHRGRLLELWAKKQSHNREGWVALHEKKSIPDADNQELIKGEDPMVLDG